MAGTTIETIRELAGRFRDNERNLTLYFADLDTPPEPGSLNQVFGPPVGVTDAQWPTFPELAELLMQANGLQHWDPRDQRMEHVFTVDLRGVDLLGAPADAAAMMLFISNASFHRACHDGNRHTAVLFLRADELQRGIYQGPLPRRSMSRWSRRFSLVAIDVPGDVFDVPHLDLPADDPLAKLFDAIAEAPARLGGCPIGLPDDEDGWAQSTPTLPWGTRRPEGSVPPLDDEHENTVVFQRAHAPLTVPYQPARMAQSSRTIPYDPHRRSSERANRRRSRAGTFTDGDPAGVPTFGHHPTPPPPFLMQFHRRFADINLGQAGVMYVSGRSAYYQSH